MTFEKVNKYCSIIKRLQLFLSDGRRKIIKNNCVYYFYNVVISFSIYRTSRLDDSTRLIGKGTRSLWNASLIISIWILISSVV